MYDIFIFRIGVPLHIIEKAHKMVKQACGFVLMAFLLYETAAIDKDILYERTSYSECSSYMTMPVTGTSEECAIWCRQQVSNCPNQCAGFLLNTTGCYLCLDCPQPPYETGLLDVTGYFLFIDTLILKGTHMIFL